MLAGGSPGALDLERAGLLEGCDAEGRVERQRLVEFLHERGVGVAQMREAIAEDRLPMLASERALAGDLNYTVRDIAEIADVPLEVLLDVRHAMGLVRREPDDRTLGEGDLQWARIVGRLLAAGLPYEQLLGTLRVLGRGLAHGARSIRETLAGAILDAGLSERQLALSTVQATEQLLPLAGPLLQETLRAHLLEQVQREQNTMRELRASRRLPGSREIVVCFADLVDFTGLGEQLPSDELERIASELERLTADLVEAPVQLIKTIGDAVMLVAPDAANLLDVALSLVDHAAAHDGLPALRVGVACGTATNRGGDWYGPPVNLASRVTGAAATATVVCTQAVRRAAGDAYRWRELGPRRLKGIDEDVVLLQVERNHPPPR